MYFLSIVCFVFGLYTLFIALTNKAELKRLNKIPLKTSGEKVSICIPARNEEVKIKKCVTSLLNQNYENFEVIVLDDNSTDNTLKILKKLQKEYDNLKIIQGKSLKIGWKGKLFAMQQLFEKATGHFILFTDADTFHKPNSLSKGMSIIRAKQADFLTGYPKIKMKKYWASLVVSNMIFNTAIIIPFAYQNRFHSQQFATAFGPYLLVRKSALSSINGFYSFKDKIADDVHLCKALLKNNFHQVFVDLSDVENVEMYDSFPEAFKGIGRSVVGVIPFALFPILIFLLPFLFLLGFCLIFSVILAILNGGVTLPILLMFIGGITSYICWLTTCLFHKFSLLVALSQPLTFSLVVFLYLYGIFSQVFGRKIIWKGREM